MRDDVAAAPGVAGELVLRIVWDGRAVTSVHVRSTRPLLAERLLAGRRIDDALATVPLLFTVCRHAQRAAAASAATAAGGSVASNDASLHDVAVALETLQEHLAHVLMAMPRALGYEAPIDAVADVRRRGASLLRDVERECLSAAALQGCVTAMEACARRDVYAMPSIEWASLRSLEDLRAWSACRSTLPARIVDDLLRDDAAACDRHGAALTAVDGVLSEIARALTHDADFPRTPTLRGAPAETGAFARWREHPLIQDVMARSGGVVTTRFVARLLELARLVATLADDGMADRGSPMQTLAVGPGEGVAAVETARGMLVHRACVRDDCVTQYQIVAPTEWNFHPGGVAVHALAAIAGRTPQDVERRATAIAEAFDPCVGYRVEVADA